MFFTHKNSSVRNSPTRRVRCCHFISFITFILICSNNLSHATSNKPNEIASHALTTIVVTIKPIYSLVAHLTEGITTPILLFDNMKSPHHYNLRPSERRLIAQADMIIWLGPQMERFLSKIIQQHDKTRSNIALIQADDLTLLNKRVKHAHEGEEDKEENNTQHSLTSDKTDQHIWLSTDNAKVMSIYLSNKLKARDPKNSSRYQQNLEALLIKIAKTDNEIKAVLKGNTQPFIVAHDAFQYFEHAYQLHYVAALNSGDETSTSLKHLTKIRSLIEKDKIQCIVYQNPKPAIVDSLTRNTNIKAVALNPLGLQLENYNAWFEIMQQLAAGFNQCLNP